MPRKRRLTPTDRRVLYNVYLEPEMVAALKVWAEFKGVPTSQIVRDALRTLLEDSGVLEARRLPAKADLRARLPIKKTA